MRFTNLWLKKNLFYALPHYLFFWNFPFLIYIYKDLINLFFQNLTVFYSENLTSLQRPRPYVHTCRLASFLLHVYMVFNLWKLLICFNLHILIICSRHLMTCFHKLINHSYQLIICLNECTVSIVDRDGFNTVRGSSNWDVNWSAPVQGGISPVQIKDSTSKTELLLCNRHAKPGPCSSWYNMTDCSNGRKEKEEMAGFSACSLSWKTTLTVYESEILLIGPFCEIPYQLS